MCHIQGVMTSQNSLGLPDVNILKRVHTFTCLMEQLAEVYLYFQEF